MKPVTDDTFPSNAPDITGFSIVRAFLAGSYVLVLVHNAPMRAQKGAPDMPAYVYPFTLAVLDRTSGAERMFVVLEQFNDINELWQYLPNTREPALGYGQFYELEEGFIAAAMECARAVFRWRNVEEIAPEEAVRILSSLEER